MMIFGGKGVSLIKQERKRQVYIERWTPSHDDEYRRGELAMAAVVYILAAIDPVILDNLFDHLWPWSKTWFKPEGGSIRNLVKAGALIAAEIDRRWRSEQRLKKLLY